MGFLAIPGLGRTLDLLQVWELTKQPEHGLSNQTKIQKLVEVRKRCRTELEVTKLPPCSETTWASPGMRQIQHVVAVREFQRQILGANPKDLVRQQEPGQTVSPLTLYLGRALPSSPSSHIYFGRLERAQLILAAALVMQDPNPSGRAGRAGSCSGQPEPCRASRSSLGTGNTCCTSWQGLQAWPPGRGCHGQRDCSQPVLPDCSQTHGFSH